MSGGIFPGYPLTLNIKCIIFALIIMAIYTYKAPKVSLRVNIIIYFIIFVIAYVAIVPFLTYIAIKKDKVPETVYTLLYALIAFTLVYHGIRVIQYSHK